ncbi:hypothetical protein V6Z11_D13G228900 [Gossypium hirsutum]
MAIGQNFLPIFRDGPAMSTSLILDIDIVSMDQSSQDDDDDGCGWGAVDMGKRVF